MKAVDKLWTTRRKCAQVIHRIALYLTLWVRCHRLQRAGVPDSSRERMQLSPLLCLILGSLAIQTIPAQANQADALKLYAHSRIVNDKQYQCFLHIIHRENRLWDVNAKNGSHYGIGQMRSKHYRNLDPYRQIDASIKYIKHRYGSICKAWAFHQRKGFY
jgi:hypothetical protein